MCWICFRILSLKTKDTSASSWLFDFVSQNHLRQTPKHDANVKWPSVSAAKKLSIALFWVMNQEVVAISYRRFGTIYHFSLCNNPEQRSSKDVILLVSQEFSYWRQSIHIYHLAVITWWTEHSLESSWYALTVTLRESWHAFSISKFWHSELGVHISHRWISHAKERDDTCCSFLIG